MSEAEKNQDSEQEQDEAPKKASPLPFIMVMVVLSLVAVGSGWFVAGLLQPPEMDKAATSEPASDEPASEDEPEEEVAEEEGEGEPDPAAILLDPIIVALQRSENTFIRIELAIIPQRGAEISDQESRLRIGSDVAAFVQTLQLHQILGPTGYLHLREDLLDRARLVTDGQVKDVLIVSMVAE